MTTSTAATIVGIMAMISTWNPREVLDISGIEMIFLERGGKAWDAIRREKGTYHDTTTHAYTHKHPRNLNGYFVMIFYLSRGNTHAALPDITGHLFSWIGQARHYDTSHVQLLLS